MHAFLARVEAAVRLRGLIPSGQGVLVAVSGGVDSMVLLHALHGLAPKRGWRLVVAHFNHRLRGASSGRDAQLVGRTARRLGLECVSEAGDVRTHARRQGCSIEMAARELRHEFLARTARRLGLVTVVLAHHADDQVELFFLRLLRGAGSGLAGMKWRGASPADAAVSLVRPLLDKSKAALTSYAQEAGIRFREDESNAAEDILRNRIRHQLLPLLRKSYQPGVEQTLLRTMDIVATETEFVRAAAEKWLRRRRGAFTALSVALQRQCLCVQLEQLALSPEFPLVEQLRSRPGVRCSFRDAWLVCNPITGKIRLERGVVAFAAGVEVEAELIAGQGKVVFEGVELKWSTRRWVGGDSVTRVAGQERFDADRVGPRVRLRHWRPGDRFQPIGLAGSAKLQDLFANAKVPVQERHRRLVGESADGRIFWVEGLRIGENFKLIPRTDRQLVWRWKRMDEPFS